MLNFEFFKRFDWPHFTVLFFCFQLIICKYRTLIVLVFQLCIDLEIFVGSKFFFLFKFWSPFSFKKRVKQLSPHFYTYHFVWQLKWTITLIKISRWSGQLHQFKLFVLFKLFINNKKRSPSFHHHLLSPSLLALHLHYPWTLHYPSFGYWRVVFFFRINFFSLVKSINFFLVKLHACRFKFSERKKI